MRITQKQLQQLQQTRRINNSVNSSSSVILAIDPGYGRCGWAVLSKNANESSLKNRNKNSNISLVACDLIETHQSKQLPARLAEIYDSIEYLIKKYQPQELAIESLFWSKNKKTALGVAQARGVIIVAAQNNGLKITEYTPLQVKQAVVGYGKATKKQVQVMIAKHLPGQAVSKQDDTADAIGIGLAHLQASKLAKIINQFNN